MISKDQRIAKAIDFTHPELFYSFPRGKNRRIVYHYGPPNSAKTHDVIDQFQKAYTGIYCAPLRLLARENFDRCQKNGVPCDLITGEEKVYCYSDGSLANHMCCTVFAADLTFECEVAVIDEIQMIADEQSGWAFTRALLGLRAKTLLLCGDHTALDIVQRLVGAERFSTWPHHRPTELQLSPSLNSSFANIRDGDCIVGFSRPKIVQIARLLAQLGKKSAHIYGVLPPNVKIRQAKIFSETNSTNILVATDAIGMGMNLPIARIVFYDLQRNRKCISAAKLQQIAGRAGRMHSKFDKGYVTTFHQKDFAKMKELLFMKLPAAPKAGLLPTGDQMKEFCLAQQAPNVASLNEPPSTLCRSTSLPSGKALPAYIREFRSRVRLNEMNYFLCDLDELLSKAEALEGIVMEFDEKYRLCQAPIPIRQDNFSLSLLRAVATCVAGKKEVEATQFQGMMQWTELFTARTFNDLQRLEFWASACSLYNWLAIEFPSLFTDKRSMHRIENKVIDKLNLVMDNLGLLIN